MSEASYQSIPERTPPREWVYTGHRLPVRLSRHASQAQVVTRNGRLLNAGADFNWGYAGTGPGNLAHQILLDYTGNAELASEYAYWFTINIIADLPDRWEFTGAHVERWLKAQEINPDPAEDYAAILVAEVA